MTKTKNKYATPVHKMMPLTPEDLWKPGWEKAFPEEGEVEAVRNYLKQFAEPHYVVTEEGTSRRHCNRCDALMDSFGHALGVPDNAVYEWSLAHGEAFCSRCYQPARGHHSIKLGEKELVAITNFYLEYLTQETTDGN